MYIKDFLPGTDLCPYLFCLSFYLLYFVPPPFRDMGCLSGCLMSSASFQKLFCGICSAFVGEKVVSPSYSSAILGPAPHLKYFYHKIFFSRVYVTHQDIIVHSSRLQKNKLVNPLNCFLTWFLLLSFSFSTVFIVFLFLTLLGFLFLSCIIFIFCFFQIWK